MAGQTGHFRRAAAGRGKNKEGSILVKRVCRPGRDGQFPPLGVAEWATLLSYNVQDVLLLREVYDEVADYGEPDVIEVDRIINERGIRFDTELASSLLRLDSEQNRLVVSSLEGLTGGEVKESDLNRVKHLLQWFRGRGVNLANLRRGTLEAFLSDSHARGVPIDAAVTAVITARLSTSRNATKKLRKAFNLVDNDGLVRDQLVYHKGHTGRWAGRDVQLQNLPRPHSAITNIETLIRLAPDPVKFRNAIPNGVSVEDALSSLIRSCFVPEPGHTFCIADLASIEARGAA